MTKAIAIRLPPELVDESKAKASAAGLTFTAYVKRSLIALNAAPSILEQPMTAIDVHGTVEPSMPLQPTSGVPHETPDHHKLGGWQRPPQDECTHPYRDSQNKCRVCGHQR